MTAGNTHLAAEAEEVAPARLRLWTEKAFVLRQNPRRQLTAAFPASPTWAMMMVSPSRVRVALPHVGRAWSLLFVGVSLVPQAVTVVSLLRNPAVVTLRNTNKTDKI